MRTAIDLVCRELVLFARFAGFYLTGGVLCGAASGHVGFIFACNQCVVFAVSGWDTAGSRGGSGRVFRVWTRFRTLTLAGVGTNDK